MSATKAQSRGSVFGSLDSTQIIPLLIRLVIIGIADVFALLLGQAIISDGNVFLGVTVILTAVGLSIVNLRPDLIPLRWMTPALGLIAMLVIYPMIYTAYVGFTNYSDGHRYTKVEAVELMANEKYLPEGEASYQWDVFRADDGTYGLWLRAADGSAFFVTPGAEQVAVAPNESGTPPYDNNGVPSAYEGYALLAGGERFRALTEIQNMQFGAEDNPVGIASRSAAGLFRQRWVYDEQQDTVIDQTNGTVYAADNSTGYFVARDGARAPLGFWVVIGFDNFLRIFNSPVIGGPLVRVFLWTFAFAFFSVTTSFALGLGMALVLNTNFRAARIVRSLLIIPYAIPGMISILIWRGMLNPNVGIVTTTIQDVFGWAPPWFSDGGWAKVAVLLVNLWLSYPYFMLVCSGSLQGIPSSIYEAAEVDGANKWQQFWKLTLPLLLVAVGPLLIASFTFNFNNFLLIEALFEGGPPMVGTSAPPVGHTDNLISYTYRFAFSAGGTRDYGFASAIAIIIFIIVGLLTLLQFRFTKRLEEISENV